MPVIKVRKRPSISSGMGAWKVLGSSFPGCKRSLAGKRPHHVNHMIAEPGRNTPSSAVQAVTYYRISNMCQVNTDLVCSSGFEFDLEQAET